MGVTGCLTGHILTEEKENKTAAVLGPFPGTASRQGAFSSLADEGGPMGTQTSLLRVAASCPRCGTRPALRITRQAVEAARKQPPGTALGTYQCQRRGCGEIYTIVARAHQNAW